MPGNQNENARSAPRSAPENLPGQRELVSCAAIAQRDCRSLVEPTHGREQARAQQRHGAIDRARNVHAAPRQARVFERPTLFGPEDLFPEDEDIYFVDSLLGRELVYLEDKPVELA